MTRLIHILAVLAAVAALSLTKPAFAKDSLDKAIKGISEDIEIYLKDKKQLQISIGNFEGPPGNSAGRKLENLLKEELESRSIEVATIARWQVRGEFQVDTDAKFARISIQIRLVNSAGVEVSEFRKRAEVSIDQLEDVLAIAQPSSFDGESVVLQQNENAVAETPADPGESEQGAAQVAGTEPAPPASDAKPADPPASNAGSGNSNSQPPATTVAQNSSNPPAGSTPATSTPPAGNPPATNPPPGNPANSVASSPGGSPPPVGTATGGNPGSGGAGQQSGTAALPDAQTRDQRLRESILTQGFHQVDPNTIAASSTSPYHVQVKVRRRGEPLYQPIPISELGGGLAFCDLQEGDQYSIVVTNNAPHDVGLELSIDGINSLYFSENAAFAEHGKWVIKGTNNNGGQPYTARIDGWYRNPASVYAFQISAEPDAVASTLGFPAKIGTITATFYGAWVGDDIHPLEAKLLADLGSTRGTQIGTSKGPELGSQSSVVERKFGRFPLASVSIRYINPDPPQNLPINNPPGN